VTAWPSWLVTTTSTRPAACGGVVTVTEVLALADGTTATPPKETTGLTNSAPVMVTTVPPTSKPLVGVTLETIGAFPTGAAA